MKLATHDPLNIPATEEQLWETRLAINEMPLQVATNEVFDFDEVAEKYMRRTLEGWVHLGVTTIDWRVKDSAPVSCTLVQLQAFFDELKQLQVQRALIVEGQYLTYRATGATLRDLENWRALHAL